MKKTFTININGIVFNIEKDAYEVLQKYMINLKNQFNDEDEKDIIFDIEARIAELFNEKFITKKNEVITMDSVNKIIKIMGNPEEFEEKGEPIIPTKKRLYRDPKQKVIGGVCGGLAAYFNMDPVVIRLIAVLLFFLAGATLIAYIILWIAVPNATNTAHRLEMQGKKANVKNIKNYNENKK